MSFDLALIGLGPASLSLLALLQDEKVGEVVRQTYIFEKNEELEWHSAQNFPESTLQNEFYRDLVTVVSPTSEYSFLNYLKENNRLFRFINTGIISPSRTEFEDYLKWAKDKLVLTQFNACISVDFDAHSKKFICKSGADEISVDHLSLGIGRKPKIPNGIALDSRVVHVSDLDMDTVCDFKRVAVIGGGQSAAETFLYLLSTSKTLHELVWLTGASGLKSLDTGNFQRELFSASASAVTNDLSKEVMEEYKAAFGGISPWTNAEIYHQLYSQLLQEHAQKVDIYPTGKVLNIEGYDLERKVEFVSGVQKSRAITTDLVILCTGFSQSIGSEISFSKQLATTIRQAKLEGEYMMQVSEKNSLMIQSFVTARIGKAGESYVCSPIRNAMFINKICEKEIFSASVNDSFVRW